MKLGIIFTGGESPEPDASRRLLEKVREENILIIAADSGLNTAHNVGIKPDIIIGDMDSVDEELLSAYLPGNVMRHRHDKDYSDTELALTEAVKRGCSECWLIGGGGGRADHFLAIRSLFERDKFPARWLTNGEDIRCLDANLPCCTLSCTVKEESAVSVFPLGDGPWRIKSAGLKWPLDNLEWNRGFFSLSNTAPNGEFSVTAQKGRFLIIMEVLCRQ